MLSQTPEEVEGATDPSASNLLEAVAGETAQLLIEAAEARELAMMMTNEPTVGDLLKSATALEERAASWERRLGWWKRLGQHGRTRTA